MTRRISVSADVVARQRRAADPTASIWVSANAGSGKTHVLTERVLRLLLTGVAPEQILCLTYTKAAAAEMRKRVSGRLGRWALLDDAALMDELATLEGAAPETRTLTRARTLFAHALETPGGLKIMTIHAFCESVLHRFPKEAAVPFDFTVVEDAERDRIVLRARESVLAEGLRGSADSVAVDTLFGLLSDSQISDAIAAALADQRTLRKVIADVAGAKRRLRRLVGAPNGPLLERVMTEIAEGYGLDARDHAAIFALVPPNPGGSGFADKLGRIDPAQPRPRDLLATFLTLDGTARKMLLKKADMAALGDVAQRLADEAARLGGLAQELVGAELVERSEALLDVLAAISARYEHEKQARSLLDFDDLIEALRQLIGNPAIGDWIRYKLDKGITHLLVDEGQDTNAEQWRVVRALTGDFFDGDGAAQRLRTVFAVGDSKQSIYSFQGADPELFVDAGREYGLLVHSARMDFATVPLKTSFRTLPEILRAVDLTFARADLRGGVLAEDEPVAHDSARTDTGGAVTLWPPIKEDGDDADPDRWATEAPPVTRKGAPRRVAERIAGEIKNWVASGRPLGARQRPVRADDVLILVQTRGPLFREIIRALVRADLPTPGADRLAVTSHIAVLDLMALGDVLLNPADDLQLAALLRSPLFGVNEEDLFAIAQPRPEKTRLWPALAASTLPAAKAAYEKLRRWRGRLDFERPFEFFAEVLYREEGLKRFHARLGGEVDDVLAAFLDLALAHERSAQPSLQGFLAALRASDVTIKRELAESGGGVRVMTVHGAKGLEAPIVILADAASSEKGRGGTPVFFGNGKTGPLLVHASSARSHVAPTLSLREDDEENQAREYWRKLYVAMTRAEDELYVTGALTKTGKLDGSWYGAIEEALRPQAEIVEVDGVETALAFPAVPVAVQATGARVPHEAAIEAPLLPPLPEYRLRPIIRPSSASPDAERALDNAAARLGDPRAPEAARKEGLALHALLQHLSRLPHEQWSAVAAKALAALWPEQPDRHVAVAAKAISILKRGEFAALFGPASRAEVPVFAKGMRNRAPVTIVGRIDRLLVEPERVLVVDFKSDAAVTEAVPAPYLAQLGLYALCAGQLFPGLPVEAAILWTGLESLTILDRNRLRDAVSGFTIG